MDSFCVDLIKFKDPFSEMNESVAFEVLDVSRLPTNKLSEILDL